MKELEMRLRDKTAKYEEDIARMSRENEEKVGLLLHQLRGIQCKSRFLIVMLAVNAHFCVINRRR